MQLKSKSGVSLLNLDYFKECVLEEQENVFYYLYIIPLSNTINDHPSYLHPDSSVVLSISDYHLLCAIGKHTLMTTGYDAIYQTDCPSFLKATDVHHPGAHRLTLIAIMAIPSISPMNKPKLAKLIDNVTSRRHKMMREKCKPFDFACRNISSNEQVIVVQNQTTNYDVINSEYLGYVMQLLAANCEHKDGLA
jgi:hypothetical protein